MERQAFSGKATALLKLAQSTNDAGPSVLVEMTADQKSQDLASQERGRLLAEQMSKAIELIVDCHVRLHNRGTLEKMEAERMQLLDGLSQAGGRSGCSIAGQIEQELEEIRSGLARMNSAGR